MNPEKIGPKKSALVIIDMLNDFVEEKGTLVVEGAKALIPNQKKILEKARDESMTVIYLRKNHMPNDPEFDIWPKHAVAGTWGSQVVDGLAPQSGEKVIPKRRYSGFFGTDLDLTLREAGVEKIVLMGVLTDICVMYTSADASARGYEVFVASDATDSIKKENHEFALQHMKDVHSSHILETSQLLELMS